jgi:YfiH family protein
MSAARAVPGTWTERDGLIWSPLLASRGVVAGFTTRSFGSLGGQATAPDAARRARDALARYLGFPSLVRVRQVHGDRALYAAAPFDPPWPEADALWTDRPGVLLGVAAADCVPLLIADPRGRVGAAHAGWAGTSLRVAQRLVEAMGDDPSRLAASLGPSIGPCCYTVDGDRAAVIRERLGEGAL